MTRVRGDATRIVVPVDLSTGFVGQLSPLLSRFGHHPSLLRATISRLVEFDIAPIVVCSRDTGANREIDELLDGLDVEVNYGPAIGDLAVGQALESSGASTAALVDPRAAFVSGTLLRAQLENHSKQLPELTLSPMAVGGLGGVIATVAAMDRLFATFSREAHRGMDGDLFLFVHHIRSAFRVSDHDCDRRFVCRVLDLCPRTVAEVDHLHPYALEGTDEAYDDLFSRLASEVWLARRAPVRGRPPAKPRILMGHYTQRRNVGSTRVFEMVVNDWDRATWDVVVAVPGEGELHRALAPTRTRIVQTQLESLGLEHGDALGLRFAREVESCTELLRAESPDVVYVSGTLPTLAVAARQLAIPVLCHMHIPLLTKNVAISAEFCSLAGLTLYDHIVTAAFWYRDALQDQFRPPAGRLTTIHCGIDLELFRPDQHDKLTARRRFGLPEDSPIVAVIGLLSAFKQPEVALDCLPFLPGVTLAFAGKESLPGYQAKLQARAERLGVASRVHFVGHVDTASFLAAADLLLHCNTDEPFGLVLVEAMAMKLPVVAPDVAGPREIVVDGETGFLFPTTASSEQIASLVRKTLDDRACSVEMGEAGRRRASDHFGKPMFLRRLDASCRLLLGA